MQFHIEQRYNPDLIYIYIMAWFGFMAYQPLLVIEFQTLFLQVY